MAPTPALRALWLVLAAAPACKPANEVIVFHAASLSRAFGDLSLRLAPGLRVRLEPSASAVAVRKVSEQGQRADVVAVADEAVLEELGGGRAPSIVVFATDELVLVHQAHSPGTAEVTPDNWPDVVLGDGVRLGCANPDLTPLGYHTLMAWDLAQQELGRPGLASRLRRACLLRAPASDEEELVALLEAKAVDYAFLSGSTAEAHRLKVTRLPDEVNLSRRSLSAVYARASAEVHRHSGDPPTTLTGRPITYALAVLADAPNTPGAKAFVEFLTSKEGQRTLARHGFHPVEAPR